MIGNCVTCGLVFDDEKQSPACPHGLISYPILPCPPSMFDGGVVPARQEVPGEGRREVNIEQTGNIPPIIVRTLEVSHAYPDEFAGDKLQIIDGEHRWKYAKETGQAEIEVRIWTGISDIRADVLLAAFNHTHGESDPKKRRQLLRGILEIENDAEALATVLPESTEELVKAALAVAEAKVGEAKKAARALSRVEPLTVFVLPEQGERIRAAIQMAKDEVESECMEGAALELICSLFIDGRES